MRSRAEPLLQDARWGSRPHGLSGSAPRYVGCRRPSRSEPVSDRWLRPSECIDWHAGLRGKGSVIWTRKLHHPRHPRGLSMRTKCHEREPTTTDYYRIRTRITTSWRRFRGGHPTFLYFVARPQASRSRCSLTSPIAYLHRHLQSNPSTANAIPHACRLVSLACARTVLTYRSVWDSPSLSTAGDIRTNSRLWIRGGTVGSSLVSGCVEGLRGPEGAI